MTEKEYKTYFASLRKCPVFWKKVRVLTRVGEVTLNGDELVSGKPLENANSIAFLEKNADSFKEYLKVCAKVTEEAQQAIKGLNDMKAKLTRNYESAVLQMQPYREKVAEKFIENCGYPYANKVDIPFDMDKFRKKEEVAYMCHTFLVCLNSKDIEYVAAGVFCINGKSGYLEAVRRLHKAKTDIRFNRDDYEKETEKEKAI